MCQSTATCAQQRLFTIHSQDPRLLFWTGTTRLFRKERKRNTLRRSERKCGLPDPATIGVHRIYHAVNYGDGLPETKYQNVPVVRGILVSVVDFSHVFGTAGDYYVSARAGCMACLGSPFAVRPRSVHTEAKCATIANFARKGVDEDHPDTGDMTVYYAWESSTGRGRLEDFRNCKMRECVRYRHGTRCDSRWRRFAWPSPWRRIGTEDPTILPKEEQDQIVLANGGGMQDTHHSRIKHIRPRYTEAEFSAKQLYQAYALARRTLRTAEGLPHGRTCLPCR